jgi:hypothetical protein
MEDKNSGIKDRMNDFSFVVEKPSKKDDESVRKPQDVKKSK